MESISVSAAAGAAVRRRPLHGDNPNWAAQILDDDNDDFTEVGFTSSSSVSIQRTTTELEIFDKFAWIFTRDTELRDLLALGLEKVGLERLQRNFRRILILYAEDLQILADTSLKSQILRLFRRGIRRVAHDVVLQARGGFNSSQPDFRQIAQLVNQNYPDNSDDFDDYDDNDSEVDLSLVQSVVHFLSSDPPLINLKANLRRLVSPGLEKSGTEPKSAEVNPDHSDEKVVTLGAWISLTRGCICIITLGSIFILLSVFLGVYFTVDKSYGYSMGDAFTLAGFVFAVGTMIDCALMSYHYPRCKCWQKETAESISLLSRGTSRDSV